MRKASYLIALFGFVLVVGLAGGCMKSVPLDNLQSRGGLTYEPNEDKPFTGRAVSFHENGQKKEEGAFKDGQPIGTHTLWNENGQKQMEGEWVDGQKHGTWTTWYNGQKRREGTYKDGQQHGPWTYWNEDGSLDRTVTY